MLVIACGPWSPSATVGVDLPIRPLCRQILETSPLAALPEDLPMVIEVETGFHFRRRGDRLLLAMGDPSPRWTFDTTVDESFVPDRLERLARRYPPAAGATIEHSWAGLYDMTPDAHPIVGRVADGVFAACGLGHGFMQSPAVGRALAEQIIAGTSSLDLSPYALERFEHGATFPSDSFSKLWPGKQYRERDDCEIAHEQQPRLALRKVVGERPVVMGEPQLGEHEHCSEQRAPRDPAAPAHERDERHEPDHELRREDLAERERRGDRRCGVRDEPLSIRGRPCIEHPDVHEHDGADDGRRDRGRVSARTRGILRAEGRHDMQVRAEEMVQCDQHRAAEALELQRPCDLRVEARTQAGRRQDCKRDEDGSLDEHKACQPRDGCARAARPPDVRDEQRREHCRPQLRRDRTTQTESSEHEPLGAAAPRGRALRAPRATDRSATGRPTPSATARSR